MARKKNTTFTFFCTKKLTNFGVPQTLLEYEVTLTSHFSKTDWILHGKSWRGRVGGIFFSNLGGDNRMTRGERAPLSLPFTP